MLKQSLNLIDLSISLPKFLPNIDISLIFEDLLHLVKCIRYRMVSGSGICIFPDRDDILKKKEFQSIG